MIKKRSLEGRSYLRFNYPGPNNNIEISLYLPFFQNISIKESQKANYAVYDLLSRAGNLYAYMGAKSRSFSLQFVMTLPHIKQFLSDEGLEFSFNPKSGVKTKQDLRDNFLNKTSTLFNQSNEHRKVFQSLSDDSSNPSFTTFNDIVDPRRIPPDFFKKDDKAINLYLFWINMVRTSVINHSLNSNQGPPIIIINHGTLYNQIPCVCTNFEINVDDSAGYHLQTMTPRKVSISMQLEEVRTGSWGQYTRGSQSEGNNLAGWDSFITYETLDPYVNILQ